MTIKTSVAATTLLLASTLTLAEEAPKVWTTQAELGAIMTSGNTKGTSVTGKIDSKQELVQWSNEYSLGGYFKEDEITDLDGNKKTEKSAERFFVSAKGGYKLDDDFAKLYVLGSYTDDSFGAYQK